MWKRVKTGPSAPGRTDAAVDGMGLQGRWWRKVAQGGLKARAGGIIREMLSREGKWAAVGEKSCSRIVRVGMWVEVSKT